MGQAPKLTADQRAELIRLFRERKLNDMKTLARQLGVSPYYGSILEARERDPYERSRKGWDRAQKAGPVLA